MPRSKLRLSYSIKLSCLVAILYAGAVQVSAQAVRKIAFTHGGTAVSHRIAVINEDGTGQVILSDGGSDRDASWSPDGEHIAFSGNRLGGNQIMRMKADGTGQVPLTNSIFPESNGEPAWSPDGTKIAFTSNRAEQRRNEIWVMNADGANPVRLTVNVKLSEDGFGPVYGMDFGPVWSPDGSKIAFWSTRDGLANPEIYVMNADGTNPVRLTINPAEDRDPFWSRDGQWIGYQSRGAGRNGLFQIGVDGANDHELPMQGFNPDWSPDGQKLALTDFDPSANFTMAIYLVNADGSNRVKLTKNTFTDDWSPAWQTLGGPAPPPPPPAPVFTVTGRVIDTSIAIAGPGVPGVTITLTGSSSQTTTSDANGNFSFGNLPENGNFTLKASSSNYSFFPTERTFSTSPPLIGFVGRNISVQFDAAPIFLQFISDTNNGFEGSSAVVTVERVGFITGTSTIQYSTVNGTAVAGTDYVATTGTLTFNPGDSLKSFTVPLTYDKLVEPDETITLTLTNPTGGIARGRQTVVLTVSDPFPQLATLLNSSLAGAVTGETLLRDPFPHNSISFFGAVPGQSIPTRVALFTRFVDLLPEENTSAVTAVALDAGQVSHDLPVEFVGKVPGIDDLTQINIRLPANLPVGDLFVNIRLRGRGSNFARIRVTQ